MDNEEEIQLTDICQELLILNKITVEHLFQLKEDSALILYIFYYKTAKWQGTNKIYATDNYVKQSLDWGNSKLNKAKNILKEQKLIDIVQKRNGNRIGGWFIKVNYFIKDQEPYFQEPYFQEPQNSTSSKQQTNTINNNKLNEFNLYNNFDQGIQCDCISNSTKERCMRKSSFNINGKNYCNQHARNVISKLFNNKDENIKHYEEEFEILWEEYPNKRGKSTAKKEFIKARKEGIPYGTIEQGLQNYIQYIKLSKTEQKYIANGSTWFHQRRWEDEYTDKDVSLSARINNDPEFQEMLKKGLID